MADKTITQLTAATALAGTEVVPVVQSGTTKKATVSQILAPAAGGGIDFSANGGDVLSQYDEGTWTPADFSGAGLTFTAAGSYTRIGRTVLFSAEITYPVTANAAWAAINGLPFARSAGAVGGGVTLAAGVSAGYTFPLLSGATGGYLFKIGDQGTHALNSDLSGQTIQIVGSYTV
jgi:hypothetical protein